MPEARLLSRGFQPLVTWQTGYHIRGTCQRTYEGVTVFYHSYCRVNAQNLVSVFSCNSYEQPMKFNVSSEVLGLIYSKKSRIYVASCQDCTLRTFSEDFELMSSAKAPSTILCLTFNDSRCELYTGGVGEVIVWSLRPKIHNALIQHSVVKCSLQPDEWVYDLYYDTLGKKLIVSTQTTIYLVNIEKNKEIGKYTNILSPNASISCTILCDKIKCLIVGSSTGPIAIWNYNIDSLVHDLRGHTKGVTGLATHHQWSPSVISCSRDKTVKMWNLESMIECYSVHCEGELIGLCWEFPRLTCYGKYFLKIWQVHQFESHFASFDTDIVKIARVDGPPPTRSNLKMAKILTVTEDGGIRLLSPVNGKVITTLFPMFGTQLIEEVLYNFGDNLLFLLLKTNYVLVCDTQLNPCLTREIWIPSIRPYKVNTLAMVDITLSNNKVHSLLFGGQLDGDIILVHSTQSILSMPSPCPAHDSRMTKLVGAAEPICSGVVGTGGGVTGQIALISYGKLSDRIHVWGVMVDEVKFTLRLQLFMIVKMGSQPSFISLMDSTVCLVMEGCKVVMFRARQEKKATSPVQVESITTIKTLEPQPEEQHTKEVTSLSACYYLKLFVTSSKDGSIKVWSFSNQLISDIEFGGPVACVAFANHRGDLLVGARIEVSVIFTEDYLPEKYSNMASMCPYWDHKERPIQFDPHLEFWYDADRVHALPLDQEKRAHYLLRHPELDLIDHPSHLLRDRFLHSILSTKDVRLLSSSSSASSSGDLSSERPFCSEVFQGEVDVYQARDHSQHYFTNLRVASSKRITVVKQKSRESVQTSHSTIVSGQSALVLESSMSSVSVSVEVSYLSVVTVEPWYTPYADVAPLAIPSDVKPIAPDGFIPNSVVRKVLHGPNVKTPPQEKPYRPPSISHLFHVNSAVSLELYDWLLERVIHKCHKVGVENTRRVVSVVTGIFNKLPRETEEITRQLADDDEEDFDMMAFFTFFSSREALKQKLGSEIYYLFDRYSKMGSSTVENPSQMSFSVFSPPHSAKVDGDSAGRRPDFLKSKHLFKPTKMSTYSFSTHSTKQQTTSPTSSSGSSVRSAMKLKWSSLSSAYSSRAPSSLTQSAKVSSGRGQYGKFQRKLSSATTKLSLAIPSEPSVSFSDRSSASTARDVKMPQSALKHSTSPSPKGQSRPSSVTFASPVVLTDLSSENLKRVTERDKKVTSESGKGVIESDQRVTKRVKESSQGLTEGISERGQERVMEGDQRVTESKMRVKKASESEVVEEGKVESKERSQSPQADQDTEEDDTFSSEQIPENYIESILRNDPEELDTDEQMLKEILTKPYFPITFIAGENKEDTTDNAFKGLLQALGTDNIYTFGDVADTLLALHESNMLNFEQENQLSLQLGARLRACSSIVRQAGDLAFFGVRRGSALSDLTPSETGSIATARTAESEDDETLREQSRMLTKRFIRFHRRAVSVNTDNRTRASSVLTALSSRSSSEGDLGRLLAYLEEQEAAELARKKIEEEEGEVNEDSVSGRARPKPKPSEDTVGEVTSITVSTNTREASPQLSVISELSQKPATEGGDSFVGTDKGGSESFTESGIGGPPIKIHLSSDSEVRHDFGEEFEKERRRAPSKRVRSSDVETLHPDKDARMRFSSTERQAGMAETQFSEFQNYWVTQKSQHLEVSSEYQQKFVSSIEHWLIKLARSAGTPENVPATIKASIAKARGDVAQKILKVLERLGSRVCDKDVIAAIIPLLVDKNVEVSTQAIKTIQSIANVNSRDELRELCIKYKIIRHEASNDRNVLNDLEDRIKKGFKPSLKFMKERYLQRRDSYLRKKTLRASRRPSTPPALIHKLKTTPLKRYTTSFDHTLVDHTTLDHKKFASLPRRAGTIDNTKLDFKKFGSLPPLDKTQLTGSMRKLEAKEDEETKQVLYTFYTKDEDLVATGKKVYSRVARKSDSSTTIFSQEAAESKQYRHYMWDSERGKVVRTTRNTSKLFQEFMKNPVNFSRTEVAIRWMLGEYREEEEQQPVKRKKVEFKAPVSEELQVDSTFSERYNRVPRTICPVQCREEQHKPMIQSKYKVHYERKDSIQVPKRTTECDDIHMKAQGENLSAHSQEFKWTDIYPVVKTTSKFLIDRSPLSFMPKTLSMEQHEDGRVGSRPSTRLSTRLSTQPATSTQPQHSFIDISLPNVLL